MLKATERRFIHMEDLRALCIKRNWMTLSNADQYDKFLCRWGQVENLDPSKILSMAREVFNLSEVDEVYGEDYTIEEILSAVMFDIADGCTSTFSVAYYQ